MWTLICRNTFLVLLDHNERMIGYDFMLDEMMLIGTTPEEGITNWKLYNTEKWHILDEKGNPVQSVYGRSIAVELLSQTFPETTREEEAHWKMMIDTLKKAYPENPIIGEYTHEPWMGDIRDVLWGCLLEIELRKAKVIEFSDLYTDVLRDNGFKGKTPFDVTVELFNRTKVKGVLP